MVHEIEIERTEKGWWADCSCGWFQAARTKKAARELAAGHTSQS